MNSKINYDLDINVFRNIDNGNFYKTIWFSTLNHKEELKKTLKNEILTFFKYLNINNKQHIFIVGLGNENHTVDSVGPRTLKYIKVNSYLENLGIEIIGNKISALEPGVLGETGILTERIIKSIVDDIKPDLVILIDSFVSNDINYLNKTIEITNAGIYSGSGLKIINSCIDKCSLGVPTLVIGVTTAIELSFSKDKSVTPYLLSSNDIDSYVSDISKIIGESINDAILDLL